MGKLCINTTSYVNRSADIAAETFLERHDFTKFGRD